MDKLIEVVNRESDYHRVNTFYSTPELYTQEKHRESLTWSLKRDDFVPICQNNPEPTQGHKFWAGFFSSRSSLKRHHRESSCYLQAARKLQWQAALVLQAFPVRFDEGAHDRGVAGCLKWLKRRSGGDRDDRDEMWPGVSRGVNRARCERA